MNRINPLYNVYFAEYKKSPFSSLQNPNGETNAQMPVGERTTFSEEAMRIAALQSKLGENEIARFGYPAPLVYSRRSLGSSK